MPRAHLCSYEREGRAVKAVKMNVTEARASVQGKPGEYAVFGRAHLKYINVLANKRHHTCTAVVPAFLWFENVLLSDAPSALCSFSVVSLFRKLLVLSPYKGTRGVFLANACSRCIWIRVHN